MAWESATPSAAKQTTPSDDEDERAPGSRCGQSTPKKQLAGEGDEADLDDRVGDGVGRDPAEVGARRQRRAAHALENPVLAQEDEVHGQRGERRRHHAHAGDARHDHVEVLLLLGEDRPEQHRKSNGSTKLKKAALGLRQNILRSRRYWRQTAAVT